MKPTEKRRKTKPEEEEPQEEEGAFSLAFPSFGTGVFQYDKKRAAQVACKVPPLPIEAINCWSRK